MKVSLLSLGCPKNLADSEALLAALDRKGIGYCRDPRDADVMLINTCGFIEDARRESIEEILSLSRLRGRRRKLLVYGCMAKRYREELLREIPEMDAIFGVGEEEAIAAYISGLAGAGPSPEGACSAYRPGVLYREGPCPFSAPLKVAEGCNRRCSFCAIPSIRGRFRSRNPDEVLREAESLIRAGVKELTLVAQDLAGYGRGLGGYGLGRLIRDLASIGGDFWIRLMYLYPSSISGGLLEVIAEEPKVCNYLDIPFQHSETPVLRLMQRAGDRKKYLKLIAGIREAIPGAALRTTIMVGFPGEGKAEFEGLMEFVEEASFERLGVFEYSKEEGTPAASIMGHVTRRVKRARAERIIALQADISLGKNLELLGKRMRVLIERAEGGFATGRIYSQSPEVDGHTIIRLRDGCPGPGEFAWVRVLSAGDYDLEGEFV